MKPCVVIPCFNHAATVGAVARTALAYAPVIVVDDGSTEQLPECLFEKAGAGAPVAFGVSPSGGPPPEPPEGGTPNPVSRVRSDFFGCTVVRLAQNGGKAGALRAGFVRAAELGFTHVITMDADGQHFAEDLPKFLVAAQAQPDAYVVGVRNFRESGCPTHRRRSNAVSTFWYRVETGVRLRDTQCGFRCYPVALVQRLKIKSNRYAYELEFMVRAAWVGTEIVAVPVKCIYATDQTGASHFRPVRDLAHITSMNILLVLQSWFVPHSLRVAWSRGEKQGFRHALHEFFTDHAHQPAPMAGAVGLGLFFGIVPILGFQMVVAAAVAHRLQLNKAITLLASNISIPPIAPFIHVGALLLGHWIFTGQVLEISHQQMTWAHAREYFWHWLFGCMALAVLVAALGTVITYTAARIWRLLLGKPVNQGDLEA